MCVCVGVCVCEITSCCVCVGVKLNLHIYHLKVKSKPMDLFKQILIKGGCFGLRPPVQNGIAAANQCGTSQPASPSDWPSQYEAINSEAEVNPVAGMKKVLDSLGGQPSNNDYLLAREIYANWPTKRWTEDVFEKIPFAYVYVENLFCIRWDLFRRMVVVDLLLSSTFCLCVLCRYLEINSDIKKMVQLELLDSEKLDAMFQSDATSVTIRVASVGGGPAPCLLAVKDFLKSYLSSKDKELELMVSSLTGEHPQHVKFPQILSGV